MDTARENYGFQKYIVLLGVGLLTIKFAAWMITDSVSIFTDAVESIINVIAGFIGLYALYISAKPVDDDHPYGHGKVECISSSVEGSMISIAGLLIIFEAINNILHPSEISESLSFGIILIALAAAANFALGTMAVKKGKKNRSQALVASGRHLRSDTYSSAGIILGLASMYVLHRLGFSVNWLDGAIAMVFGIIILYTGVRVLRDSFDGIMDKADNELLKEVLECLKTERHSDWIDIHNLRIEKHGGMLHMDMHVTLPFMMTVREQYNEVCEVNVAVERGFGNMVEVSITGEPCQPYCCSSCTRECSERTEEFSHLIEWTVENISRNAQHASYCRNETSY